MANQYTYSTEETQRDKILRVVRERGLCTTLDIRDALGLGLDRIGMVLTRLRNDGMVEREKIPGERSARWAPTANLGDKGDFPIVVKRDCWPVGECKRDALLTAFYGAAAQR